MIVPINIAQSISAMFAFFLPQAITQSQSLHARLLCAICVINCVQLTTNSGVTAQNHTISQEIIMVHVCAIKFTAFEQSWILASGT